MSSSFAEWVRHFGITSTGIVHIGAHLAEEAELYNELGFEPVLWVEALPDIAEKASRRIVNFPKQKVICSTLSSESGKVLTFYRAGNEGSSSSLLAPHLIMAAHPEVRVSNETRVITQTMDEILSDFHQYKFLCMDVQGAELEVLKGGPEALKRFDFVMSEVSIRQLYKGAPKFNEITNFLLRNGYLLIASNINQTTGWGDALYISQTRFVDLSSEQRIGLHTRGTQGLGLFTKIRGVAVTLGIEPNWIDPKKFLSRILGKGIKKNGD